MHQQGWWLGDVRCTEAKIAGWQIGTAEALCATDLSGICTSLSSHFKYKVNIAMVFQGRGLGLRLIQAVFEHVRQKHEQGVCPIPSISLLTTGSLYAAVEVYRRAGFQLTDTFPAKIGPIPYLRFLHGLEIMQFGISLDFGSQHL